MTNAIVLAAGGTGGHVFPALALAAELALRGRQPALITDRRGDRYCAAYAASGAHKFGTHVIRAGTLSARDPFGSLKGLFDILAGTIAARRLLGRLDAGAVVGFGGYPSLPTMLAALRAGLPTLIHEQNAVLGRVNRRLARRVMAIALSVPETRGLGAADQPKTTLTGTPVRAEIAAIGQRDYEPPRDDGPLELLVVGGSQGAALFASIVPAALAGLPASLKLRLSVVQQCRPEDQEKVSAAYDGQEISAETAAFFDDLPMRLDRAHLVIARAGAATVSELQAAGRPALLVPYARAMGDHQSANARALADAGSGWLMTETALTPERLRDQLKELLADPAALARAAGAARAATPRDAAQRLADLTEALIPGQPDTAATGAGGREASR